MTGSFVLLRPGWLAVCLILIAGWALCSRAARKRRAASGVAISSVLGPIAAIVIPASAIAVFAMWLVWVRSPATHLLLLSGATVTACLATIEGYRRVMTGERAALGLLLIVARFGAWTLLLIIAGRPAWDWVAVEWRKPEIVVLLDDSLSMSIDDSATVAPAGPVAATSRPVATSTTSPADSLPRGAAGGRADRSRAEIVNDRIDRLAGPLKKLGEYFELRITRLGASTPRGAAKNDAARDWRIEPSLQLTSLAAAIEREANLGAARARRPHGVLVISDGAENAESENAVRNVAKRMSEAGVALYAAGAGPRDSETRTVEIEPLNLPARIGMHDRLSVQVLGLLRGYHGADATLELVWADEIADSIDVRPDRPLFNLEHEFQTSPPAPGFQRLTARIVLGPAFGNEVFETHALIEVTQGRTRVLMLEAAPRVETAFVTRALLGDERFELTRKFLPRKPGGLESEAAIPAEMWADFDIVLIGSVPRWRLTNRSMIGLIEAVDTRGLGLLLAGGGQLFNDGRYAGTPFEEISPVALVRTDRAENWQPRFVPTEIGREHSLLRVADDAEKAWQDTPRLRGAAHLGKLKPLAITLADDAAGRPLLVSLDYGKGRVLAAAWDSTWPWAMQSDEGLALHRRFWRQLAAWLANRRPQAWVTADEVVYPLAALTAGQKTVRIRAGVTGLEDASPPARGPQSRLSDDVRVKLTAMDPDGRESPVRLQREGDVWVAELGPSDPGNYDLHFVAELAGGETLEANSQFSVAHFELEFKTPTANLALLREAAETTAEHGGRFVRIEALGDLLNDLAGIDRRTRVERPMLYDPVDRARWFWLIAMVTMLAVEWAIRKRAGLI